jgi:SAM-dependent methyltransferase
MVSRLVADGYDRMADRYLAWRMPLLDHAPADLVAGLAERLGPESRGLDLGCGAGIPGLQLLSVGRATGVDVSAEQLRRARRLVPDAVLVQADMAEVEFPEASFDAVTEFFSLTHLPRDQHAPLLARIARWLRPGGRFLGTFGAGELPEDVDSDWLGVPMYFSHFDAATNLELVAEAGLVVLGSRVVEQPEEGHGQVSFLWILAEKP